MVNNWLHDWVLKLCALMDLPIGGAITDEDGTTWTIEYLGTEGTKAVLKLTDTKDSGRTKKADIIFPDVVWKN